MSALCALVVVLLAIVGGVLGWYLETYHGAVLDGLAKRLAEGR